MIKKLFYFFFPGWRPLTIEEKSELAKRLQTETAPGKIIEVSAREMRWLCSKEYFQWKNRL